MKIHFQKSYLLSLFSMLFLLVSTNSQAQLDESINVLMGAEIIEKYKEHKEKSEEVVKVIKASGAKAEDVAKSKAAYDRAKVTFNAWIDMVIADMLDKKTRKLMLKQPDFVSWKYKGTLQEAAETLNDFYATSSYAGVTALPIAQIMIAIELAREVISLIKDIRKETKNAQKSQLYDLIKKPLTFKEWDEIK